jgi:hypothetical protein
VTTFRMRPGITTSFMLEGVVVFDVGTELHSGRA